MRVLMLPYLYFKDERQSSGIVHQSGLAHALAAAGHAVVVAMPNGPDWRYDHARWFGGRPNLTVRPVAYPQDLDLTAGVIPPALARLLTPELTDVPYDVVFFGVPEAAVPIRRFLYKKGYTRLDVPVVTYFDSVFGWDADGRSRAGRGGSRPDFIEELMWLQCLSVLAGPAVLHLSAEVAALRSNLRRLLSPSRARAAMDHLHHVVRPYQPPEPPRRRVLRGDVYRVFVARSFGWSEEEAGEQTQPVIEAVRNLWVQGVPTKLVLATQSSLDEWARRVLADAGEAVELMHRRPREEVLDALYDCELSCYLTDFSGVYASSIEAICSGSPHLAKRAPHAEGEVVGTSFVESYDVEEIMAALRAMIDDFDRLADQAYQRVDEAESRREGYLILRLSAQSKPHMLCIAQPRATSSTGCYQIGLDETARRAPAQVGLALGRVLGEAWEVANPHFTLERFPSMGATLQQVAATGQLDGQTLGDAVRVVGAARESGTLGRYSVPWLAVVLEELGYRIDLEGGLEAPVWRLRFNDQED